MKLLSKTLIPQSRVKLALASAECPYIDGVEILKVNANPKIDSPISSHADVNVCVVEDTAFVSIEQAELTNSLKKIGMQVVEVGGLSTKYPYDSRLNVAVFGKNAILNPKTADSQLVEHLKRKNFNLIFTPQGYSKCSTLPVNESAIITCDRSIEKAVLQSGIDCLYIQPNGIKLEGYDYGFIGGCGGLISPKEMLFFGDITKHRDYKKIESYLSKYDVKIITTSGSLVDLGSFLPICEC